MAATIQAKESINNQQALDDLLLNKSNKSEVSDGDNEASDSEVSVTSSE